VASADTAEPASISREYLIKAAILYNFAKFASWPAAAFSNDTAPLRICVIGADPFGPALESLNGKTVRNRALVTALIAKVEDAAACHILFVSASEKDRLGAILDTVSALPILTVADINRFANSGGIIALKEVDDRSRIEVNIGAAKQAGLKLSSKLLRLADTVGTQTARTPVSTK
ncbi:MAG: YfiR family protein, partial [Alphaproteobacteria bacterium]|nr:YfiR family protein [Alphaproteobacteria bacterium]